MFFSIQKGTVIVANGFDGTEGTLLRPLDFKNIINMKCDMYDGTIILKCDTELMTSDEEDARALFSLSCSVICPLIQSVC
jgi:hypothetical protein